MSRTVPRAYVTADWDETPVIAAMQARKYCRALVKEGYLPLCPVLAFGGIFDPDDTDAHKRMREMSEDLLRRSRFLVVCGEGRSSEVLDDITIARKSKVIVTSFNGVLGFD